MGLQTLLDRGSDPNIAGKDDIPPLYAAGSRGVVHSLCE